MSLEGQGGIQRDQLISYKSNSGQRREALFLFANQKAQRNFLDPFERGYKAESRPIPNCRYPGSQGPQDTPRKS